MAESGRNAVDANVRDPKALLMGTAVMIRAAATHVEVDVVVDDAGPPVKAAVRTKATRAHEAPKALLLRRRPAKVAVTAKVAVIAKVVAIAKAVAAERVAVTASRAKGKTLMARHAGDVDAADLALSAVEIVSKETTELPGPRALPRPKLGTKQKLRPRQQRACSLRRRGATEACETWTVNTFRASKMCSSLNA